MEVQEHQETFGPAEIYRKVSAVIAKRWWVIVCTFAVLMTGLAVYLARAPRIYEAKSSIVIDSATPQVLGGGFRDLVDVEMGSWWSAREYIQTQYQVIQSEALAREVARRLEATGDLAKLQLGPPDKALEKMVQLVQTNVRVDPIKDSRMVYIVMRYNSPEAAAMLANAVAETYIEQNLERRLTSTRGSTTWLGDRLKELKDQLEKSELSLYDFRRQNNILSVSLEDSKSILSNEITKLSEALSETKTRRLQLSARQKTLAELKTQDPLNDPWPELRESEMIAKLKETLVEQNSKLLELKGKYLEHHPALVAQQARVDSVRQELAREASLALRSLDADYKLTQETERALSTALNQSKSEALDINKKQIDYDRLKRNADQNAKAYELVLGRLKESDLAGQLRTNNVRIQDRANVPKSPTSPNVPVFLTVGLFISISLGLGVAFLLDVLDNTVKSQQDVENLLKVPFLGLIPSILGEEEPGPLYVVEHPKSTVSECCRAIRTNILFMSPDKELRSLLVTSSGPQEGKTTTSMNLGVTMALSGSRVLLVDTDLRRPRLHRAFGVPSDHGMSTLILGESALEDCIKSTAVSNLWIMPCGPLPPNPAELLHTQRFKEVLGQLCDQFDRVIFDSPPLGAVTDAAVLSTVVDGAVLVAKNGKTTKEHLSRAMQTLASVNANVLGCVLNRVDLSRRAYGYPYYYEYYRQYGYYYGEGDQAEGKPTGG